MTSIQCLRLLRPAVRAPRVFRPFQSFHVGRPSGTSRLLQEEDGAKEWTRKGADAEVQGGDATQDQSVRTSEFKKLRETMLAEASEEGLIKETHPRLVHRSNRQSVPTFRKLNSKEKLEALSEEDVVTLYGTQKQLHKSTARARGGPPAGLPSLLTMRPQAASNLSGPMGTSSCSSPLSTSSKRSRE